ncbi:efflux RND transporter permease subunit [Campylobacter sp.]|uniref:efflux RND transporter permease subunit n=1 Tax=Campylobacter sp. TaxID=205 RepID=UPI002A671C25|nr:MMPL family transporter [Campylobacter sp.]MDD7704324.1 MMPL family transporter [Campylobacteraceae bacterium]MDY2635563.1 MMPL family transporter [Campylobacter sp.]
MNKSDKIKQKLARMLVSAPKLSLALALILCAFLCAFAPKLAIDASTQTLLLENDKDLELWRDITKRYEIPNTLVIAYTPNSDLLSESSISTLAALSKDLAQIKGVKSVFSMLDAPLLLSSGLKFSDLLGTIPTLKDSNASKEAIKAEFLSSPFYKNSLVSSDFKTTALLLTLEPNSGYNEFIASITALENTLKNAENNTTAKTLLKEQRAAFKAYRDELRVAEHEQIAQIRQVIAKYNQNSQSRIPHQASSSQLFLGGINMIADDMIAFVRSDLATYGLATLLLCSLCLFVYYLQLRYVFLAIFICLVCVGAASGLFGLLGFEITVISSNYIALQLIITLSVVIHLINSYREFFRKKSSFSQKAIVYLALKERMSPCFFAIFTTIIGFISLVFSDIRPIISLGVMMSASITLSLILSFWLFGSIMSLLSKKSVNTAFERYFSLTTLCAKIALNLRARKVVFAISALGLCVGLWGISKLSVENSFIGYFKENTDIYKGMELIDNKLGGTVPLDIIISFKKDKKEPRNSSLDDEFADEFASSDAAQYWFNERRMSVLKSVNEYLKNKEFIGSVSSLADLLEVGKELNEGRELDALALALIYSSLSGERRELILTPFVSIENDELHFSVRTLDSDPRLKRAEFLRTLQNELNELVGKDADVKISGAMKLYTNMLDSLFGSQINSLGFVLLAFFATFWLIFASLRLAIIAICINILPLICVLGAMGLAGLSLDIMSITIGSISLGIGVDSAIHYIYRYKRELAHFKDSKKAIIASHASIGYALYYTSFAVFIGFGVMISSNFWPTIYFGALTDLVMFFMLASSLILLPSLLLSQSAYPANEKNKAKTTNAV